MKDEKKIVKDGFEYTFEKYQGRETCTGCVCKDGKTCSLISSCQKLDTDHGRPHHCIKKEKIEEKIVYKAGMKVVIVKSAEKEVLNESKYGPYTQDAIDSVIEGTVLTLIDKNECVKPVTWNTKEFLDIGFPEAWFKPYTEKDNKEMNTKYELVKDLTGKAIAETACSGEFEKFVKHCGFHTKVVWDLEFEKYTMEQNGWVEFLVDKGYIEESHKIDHEKPIVASKCGDVYLLLPQIEKGSYKIVGYNWFDISKNKYNSSVCFRTIGDAISSYSGYEIRNASISAC